MNTPQIMVIDDDIVMQKSIQSLLTKNDYEVNLASSGTQAIDILAKGQRPDLILLDIAMPDMDGYETFKQIRKYTETPIIFLTGMETMQSELEGLKLGAIDYITKPFVSDILLARISNHLRRRENAAAITFDDEKLEAMKNLLTDAEFKTAKRIAMGYSNQEIAEQLSYSYSYVKKIAYRIFEKLNISKRSEIREFFLK